MRKPKRPGHKYKHPDDKIVSQIEAARTCGMAVDDIARILCVSKKTLYHVPEYREALEIGMSRNKLRLVSKMNVIALKGEGDRLACAYLLDRIHGLEPNTMTVRHTGEDGGPVKVITSVAEDVIRQIEKMAGGAQDDEREGESVASPGAGVAPGEAAPEDT